MLQGRRSSKQVHLLQKRFRCCQFLEVVHCTFDEYLRRIPQHLHELHRKVPHLLSCDDKDAMTVKIKKKLKNYKLLKS